MVDTTAQEASIISLLRGWSNVRTKEDEPLEKAVILLATRTPSTFATLTGGDRAKAGLVRRAAAAAGFKVHLAEVMMTKVGEGEECVCFDEAEERDSNRQKRRDAVNDTCESRRWDRFGESEDEEEEVSDDEDVDESCICNSRGFEESAEPTIRQEILAAIVCSRRLIPCALQRRHQLPARRGRHRVRHD